MRTHTHTHMPPPPQLRGSVPLYWSQQASALSPKPDIILQNFDPMFEVSSGRVPCWVGAVCSAVRPGCGSKRTSQAPPSTRPCVDTTSSCALVVVAEGAELIAPLCTVRLPLHPVHQAGRGPTRAPSTPCVCPAHPPPSTSSASLPLGASRPSLTFTLTLTLNLTLIPSPRTHSLLQATALHFADPRS